MAKHHTILAGRGDKYSLYLTIDFEPIELQLGSEVREMPKSFGIDWWGHVIDFCCDTIGKERRDVIVKKSSERLPLFGEKVYEYLDTSDRFNCWDYYLVTETKYINNFYERYKLYPLDGSTGFHKHYESVFNSLKQQGLTDRNSYYKPSHELIDKLVKTIINN